MFKDLDESQCEALQTTLEKIKVLKYLDDIGLEIIECYVGSDSDNWEEAEQWFLDTFAIMNGHRVDLYTMEEDEYELYNLVYDEDFSTGYIDVSNEHVNEYLIRCRKEGRPVKELYGIYNFISNSVGNNGIWNDYELHDLVITTDYRLSLVTTDVFALASECFTIKFINIFMDLIRFCELSNIASRKCRDNITHCKQNHIRLPRGKKRRHRLNYERQSIGS